jgi:hypothetical protein
MRAGYRNWTETSTAFPAATTGQGGSVFTHRNRVHIGPPLTATSPSQESLDVQAADQLAAPGFY